VIPASPASADTTNSAIADRWFVWWLTAIAAVALVIRAYIGSIEFMEFDEWQQVFMASAPRWKDLAYELNAEAHPPAFYLILKALITLGHSKLLYRCIALVPGTGSVVLVGIIARKLLRSSAMALLCAAALALSTAAITISIEVRQYQLAVFFLLVAFDAFLDMWTDEAPRRRRPYVIYAVSAGLAVLCHYSAVVFLGACALLAGARWMFDSTRRRQWDWGLAASLASPLALFASLYVAHARKRGILGYLYDFYWGQTPGETLAGFLSRNVQNFWNLFALVRLPEPRDRGIVLALAAVLGLASAAIVFRTRRPGDRSTLAILLASVMVGELAGLSIARAYPFGGFLRHQYVVGPFLILAAFAVLDRLASLAGRRARIVLMTSTGLILIGHLVAEWPRLVVWPNYVVYAEEFNSYRAAFPDARAVYVDHFGVIGYFINTDDRRRRFVRRIDDVFAIDEYHINGPSGGVEIFYDKTRYTLNMRRPSLYRSLARCLKQSGAKQLTLFFFSPGDVPLRDGPDTLRRVITQTAAEQGLTATKVVVGKTTIFAGFELSQ
jgi:hypothetical protein